MIKRTLLHQNEVKKWQMFVVNSNDQPVKEFYSLNRQNSQILGTSCFFFCTVILSISKFSTHFYLLSLKTNTTFSFNNWVGIYDLWLLDRKWRNSSPLASKLWYNRPERLLKSAIEISITLVGPKVNSSSRLMCVPNMLVRTLFSAGASITIKQLIG